MISYMEIPLHKYMSIIQRYWYFFKRVITNLDRPRKTADHRHGRSKLVISLLKRSFEKVPILLNNRGIFREWYIDMRDHITAYFFRIT